MPVILSEEPSDAPLFTSVARVCGVCAQQYSKYKCPRCALQYCSLACYKSHGDACTEDFYAESTQAALKATCAHPEQQVDMVRMLQRLEAADDEGGDGCDSDGDDGSELDDDGLELGGVEDGGASEEDTSRAERLSQMLSQARIDEGQLTAEERREFRRLVADGSLGAQLQSEAPWWSQLPAGSVLGAPAPRDEGYVWGFASAAAAQAAQASRAPEPPSDLPTMRSLTRRAPCATLRFNLLEVTCAYVYAWRLYCGTFDEDPKEVCACRSHAAPLRLPVCRDCTASMTKCGSETVDALHPESRPLHRRQQPCSRSRRCSLASSRARTPPRPKPSSTSRALPRHALSPPRPGAAAPNISCVLD